jgi:uncharacterized protein YndB with AHSA1/START domain
MPDTPEAPRMSDEKVRSKTGRGWDEWFSLLDAAGAAGRSHSEIVSLLEAYPEVDAWWRQSVTVEYEKARGLRRTHQRPDGFQISVGKTIGAPVEELFHAWNDEDARAAWLPEPITVRKATPARSLRITWSDGRTHVDVTLSAKGEGRGQISLQHGKLADQEEADRMKAHWKEALDRLKSRLEGSEA